MRLGIVFNYIEILKLQCQGYRKKLIRLCKSMKMISPGLLNIYTAEIKRLLDFIDSIYVESLVCNQVLFHEV